MKLTLFFAFVLSIFGTHAAAADPKDAVTRLMKTAHFAFGGVGFAGTTSDGEAAYNEIMARATAATDFEKVFQAGNAEAKAYALTALFQLSPAKFNDLSATFRKQDTKVSTMVGCIVGHSTTASIADQIATGLYAKKK